MSRTKQAIENAILINRMHKVWDEVVDEIDFDWCEMGEIKPTFVLSYSKKSYFDGFCHAHNDAGDTKVICCNIKIKREIADTKGLEYFDAVVRHEIAHYFTWVYYGFDVKLHGSEFVGICKQLKGEI